MTSFQRTFGPSALSVVLAILSGCGGGNSAPAPTPAVTLSPTTSIAFGNALVGSVTAGATAITVTNSGNAPLIITAVTLAGANPTDFAIPAATNTCVTTLAANATCSIAVSFTPLASGTFAATISITDNAASSPQSISLSGTGVVPIASLSTATLAFPNTLGTPATTSSPLSVTLTNIGLGAMTMPVVSIAGTNPSVFAITYNSCTAALAPQAACTVSITFTPTAAGPYSATLLFTDSATPSPQTVSLTGTGTVPVASFNPTALAFPNTAVGSAAVALVTTLTNTGTGQMTISGATIVATGSNVGIFAISANNNCAGTLAPSASCTISVTFSPIAAVSYTASLSVTDTAAGSPQSIALSGMGLVSVASPSPSSLNFPATPVSVTSSALTSTLTNSGGAPLIISSIVLGGQNPTDFAFAAGNTCPTSFPSNIPANGSCVFSITFTPATTGSFSASILITDNAAGSPQSISLSGTAAIPVVSLNPTVLPFTYTDINVASAPLTVTLTNTGNGPLNFSAIGISGANFTITTQTCKVGTALAPNNNTCTVTIIFTPPAAGSYSATLSFTDNAAGSPQSVSLTGTAAIPMASFNPNVLAFPVTDVNATATLTTTITNAGNGPLLISSLLFNGAQPTYFTASDNCSNSVPANNGTCIVTVTFTPTAVATYSAALNVTDNATTSPQVIQVSGAGGIPAVTLSATTLNYNTNLVNSTEVLTAILTNTGTGPLTISSLKLSSTSNFSIASGSCSGIIQAATATAPAGTCPITLSHTPTAVASYAATFTLTDNAATSPQTISLSGSGAPEASSCKATNTTSPAQPAPTPNYPGSAFTGKVLAGSTPMIGASVQIYAAGTTGNGSTPTAMLGTALTTDSNGAFSVPASFTCPFNTSVLYAVARGGKPGATGTVNSGAVLAAVIGACNSITANPSYTINEVTTAALAWSMQPFLAAGGKIGSSSTNGSGILLAAGTSANLVNNLNGTSPGVNFPSTGASPAAKINQVANLLNACIVNASNCASLYSLTTSATLTPTNTLDAVMNLVRYPAANVASLYAASNISSAFTPVLAYTPTDFTLFINFTGGGMSDPAAISIDSTGKVWVTNYFNVASLFSNTGAPVFPSGISGTYIEESYGGGVDYNDIEWVINEQSQYFGNVNGGDGTITLLNSGGTPTMVYDAGGINFPIAVAFDTSGLSWIANYGNSQTTVLLNNGLPVSGTNGYSTYQYEFPVALATDAKCNAYVANQSSNTITYTSADGTVFGSFPLGSGPSGVAVDAANNIWEASYYGNSVGLLTSTGTVLSGTGFTNGGISHPQGIAIDGAGTAWVSNYRPSDAVPVVGNALTELAGSTTASPGAPISPSVGWGTDANMVESFGLAIDAAGNIWISNFGNNTLTEFVGMAAPVKTPLLGPVRVP